MDFLLSEITRKDKQLKDSNVMPSGKRYFKRGDMAAKQAEDYWRKHKRLKTLRDEQDSTQETDSGSESTSAMKEEKQISRKELNRRLRERQEPIKLFGEADAQAYERLKKLELMMPEVIKGFKNDFKAAMDKVDEDYLQEILQHGSTASEAEKIKAHDVNVKDDGLTLDNLIKLAEGFGKHNVDIDSEVVLGYLKLVLKLWGDELNGRPTDEKRTFRGKLASATHTQTVEYIKPLFKTLKNKSIDVTILQCLVDVAKHLLERNYLRANDAYLEMAIGNSPWPIGVTMVGIHARTGREKISDKNVAHVLNDEVQRKYIQAVKRLMTRSQKYFPTCPSKMVNYIGDKH